jgi:nitrate reductase gamma subunit
LGVIASVLAAAIALRIYLETQYNRFVLSYAVHELGSKDIIIAECYAETSLTNSVHLGILLLIVLHEVVIYPLFQRRICYIIRIKSLWKILIGIIFQVLCVTTLMALDVISRHNFLKND